MDRTTLRTLEARYTLEPELRSDIYVEGIHDQQIVQWFLGEVGIQNRKAFPIDLVDVSDEMVVASSLPTGSNRSRVLALADVLSKKFPDAPLLFLIDRDLEDFVITRTAPFPRHVKITDFGTTDMYLFHDHAIDKIIIAGLRKVNVNNISSSLFDVLRMVYSFRVAARKLDAPVRFLDLSKNVALKNNEIFFDFYAYIDRCLNASVLMGFRGDILQIISATLDDCEAIPIDKRVSANGHDLIVILKWLLDNCSDAMVCNEGVRRLLFMSLTTDVLLKNALFDQELRI